MNLAAYKDESTSYTSNIFEILPGARIIKLKGYKSNSDYSKAKTPVGKWRDSQTLEESEIATWISQGGWIGAVIPEGRIIVDIDDSTQGEAVKELLEAENVHHHSIKTPNGWQFVFKAEQKATKGIKQITKFFTSIGVVIDTRTAEAGYIVFPTENTKGRYIATKSISNLDELPNFLKPLRNSEQVKDKTTGEKYSFPIPIEESGSRNDTLYKWATHLKVWRVDPEEISRSMELVYEYFLLDKNEFPFYELRNLTKSALEWKPDKPAFQLNMEESDFPENTIIPLPFIIEGNALLKKVVKKIDGFEVEQSVMVSRIAPTIEKEFSNVERNSVHYEITWRDRGQGKREVVSASAISTKRELLTLADSGLPVNDLNFKDLISFFDKYLAHNRVEQSQMVERVGHIKGAFIHPLRAQGVEIIPTDSGERQLLEAFQAEGTAETWETEVFDRIKEHPKVLFMVLASFASVLLKDIKVSPFIIDLSGSTSQGKTTALQAARSVWGSEGLINEWNATKVSLERKAGFLNSFPLYMDDTRKADERILQSIVYQFSGGRSKGRGSLKGSQREDTWNNILISTGEVSLADYASKAGGAAARVISLIDEPFYKGYDFSTLYEALQANYGAVGLEFLKEWQINKDSLISEFYKFKDHYLQKSKGNEVLTRLSMYYAAVHFAGSVIKKLLMVTLDLKALDKLFDEMASENKALDKPKELLEQVLSDLDSDRDYIYYDFSPKKGLVKAVFKDDTLHLTPSYLKSFLGPEATMIRTEWRKRNYTYTFENKGKNVDYRQLKHGGKNFQVVPLAREIVEELGFDFQVLNTFG